MSISTQDVLNVLRTVQDPAQGRDIVSLKYVKDLVVEEGKVHFRIELALPPGPERDQLHHSAEKAVRALSGVNDVEILMTSLVQKPSTEQKAKMASTMQQQAKQQLIPTVRHVIPVASGKGGVGKSTVSVNLALSLLKKGHRVGVMDADVYGPTLPTLLGIQTQPKTLADNRLVPIEQYGLKVMSMGFFMKEGEAIVWRGPMLHKAVQQFLGGVVWGDLDYLVVDLPPGTGDIQLSLCQTIPLTGAVIVSTPQDVALQVASKAITMFGKLNCPVLGIVENMSDYVCSHCGKEDKIFGSGGAQKAAQALDVPFLGKIPLVTDIRIQSDEGKPIAVSHPDSAPAQAFLSIADQLIQQVGRKDPAQEDIKISF